LVAGDLLAIADLSASETKRITVTDLVGRATTLIADATIPGAKILFGSGTIPGSALTTGAIDAVHLGDKAVTAAKLADESTVDLVTTLPASGAFVGQIALDTDDNKVYIWDGSTWQSVKGAGSVNTVIGGHTGVVNVTVATVGDKVTINTTLDNTSAAAQFLAGPTNAAGAVQYRTIAGNDLPVASGSARGGVQVSGDGLRMDAGKIEIDNDVSASGGTYNVVDVDSKGLVVNYRQITANDLPVATDSTPGATMPGTDLEVSGTGVLNHEVKVAGGGTFTKLTVTETGHVSAGASLTAADIPALDASKITTGTFSPSLFGTKQITREMLADYSIAYIQEATPALTGNHIGVLWFQESTAQLSMWNGNSWFPIGQARLTAENLRYCGTIDATTGFVTGVTAFGTAAGYSIGDALKTATDQQTGVYFVVDTPGANISKVVGVTFDAGDWVLCNGAVSGTGYVRIDTLSGGGGGGVSKIGDLLDVTLTTPVTGDVLQYNAGGQWVNVNEFDEGTYP